jgi:uncharacterized membrane protein required for colicin V production
LCTVGGGFIGRLLGAIIGFIVGLLINVLVGGAVATLLSIDENLKQLKNDMNNQKGTVGGDAPLSLPSLGPNINKKKCKRCGEIIADDYTSCPRCAGTTFAII